MEFSEYLELQESLASFMGIEEEPSKIMNYCFEYDLNGITKDSLLMVIQKKKRGRSYKAKT